MADDPSDQAGAGKSTGKQVKRKCSVQEYSSYHCGDTSGNSSDCVEIVADKIKHASEAKVVRPCKRRRKNVYTSPTQLRRRKRARMRREDVRSLELETSKTTKTKTKIIRGKTKNKIGLCGALSATGNEENDV